MFDFLKKKITSFVNSIAGTAEEAPPQQAASALVVAQPEEEQAEARAQHELREQLSAPAQLEAQPRRTEEEKILPSPVHSKHEVDAPASTRGRSEVQELEFAPVREARAQEAEPSHTRTPAQANKQPQIASEPEAAAQYVPKRDFSASLASREPRREEKQIELAPQVGLLKRVLNVFSPELELTDKEVEPVLSDLEIALLESDVSFDTAQFLVEDLKKRMVGRKISKNRAGDEIKGLVRESFLEVLKGESFDFFNYVAAIRAKGEVAVVLFVGPNGSGKTTTIAKLARQLQDRGFSTVIAASDTFRKAAIEQAVLHGEKLGVRVVKHDYGADPTAVAFDAIAHARAVKANCVLVDTAGRQETNYNLVREMEKMQRVLSPHLKIFVGEAIAGNALIEQVKKFHESIKLDGIILTKLDCDAKGGGSFSIAFETKLPILFVGVGQGYSDLRPFEADWVVDNVFVAG